MVSVEHFSYVAVILFFCQLLTPGHKYVTMLFSKDN